MNIAIEDSLKIILKDMAINVLNLHQEATLGGEIGLDSQEIVEFACALEKKFCVSLPSTLKKTMSFGQVVDIVSNSIEGMQKQPLLFDDGFSEYCKEQIIIHCPKNVAFDAIYDFEKWTQHLPHVKEITNLYNDGKFQEFLMSIDSGKGVVNVRSIRKCDRDNWTIRFFQPKPPIYLKHHCGGWFFEDAPSNACKVVTWHQWNENPFALQEKFQTDDKDQSKTVIKNILSEHAQLALSKWKENLEKI